MIDSGITWNLILQDVIKRHELVEDDNLPQKFKALGNFKICMYQRHDMVPQARNKHSYQAIMVVLIIGADFTGCDLILEIPWL